MPCQSCWITQISAKHWVVYDPREFTWEFPRFRHAGVAFRLACTQQTRRSMHASIFSHTQSIMRAGSLDYASSGERNDRAETRKYEDFTDHFQQFWNSCGRKRVKRVTIPVPILVVHRNKEVEIRRALAPVASSLNGVLPPLLQCLQSLDALLWVSALLLCEQFRIATNSISSLRFTSPKIFRCP